MSGLDRDQFDGVFLERFRYQPSEGKLYRELSQPSRRAILERNQAIRNESGVLRDLTFGRLALTVPLEDWDALKLKYPDLASKDGEIRSRAWTRFIASAESEPYRVK